MVSALDGSIVRLTGTTGVGVAEGEVLIGIDVAEDGTTVCGVVDVVVSDVVDGAGGITIKVVNGVVGVTATAFDLRRVGAALVGRECGSPSHTIGITTKMVTKVTTSTARKDL